MTPYRLITRKLVGELTSGDDAKFQQHYWELYLAAHLIKIGYQISVDPQNHGSDFGFSVNEKKAWIEATAPAKDSNSNIETFYESERQTGRTWHNPDIFGLRWTHAITTKLKSMGNI
jgi:hypothetical protein